MKCSCGGASCLLSVSPSPVHIHIHTRPADGTARVPLRRTALSTWSSVSRGEERGEEWRGEATGDMNAQLHAFLCNVHVHERLYSGTRLSYALALYSALHERWQSLSSLLLVLNCRPAPAITTDTQPAFQVQVLFIFTLYLLYCSRSFSECFSFLNCSFT